jgi:hypothetical protein
MFFKKSGMAKPYKQADGAKVTHIIFPGTEKWIERRPGK